MESEQRGRASRASSTSSLGREVRCGCQYYQSDSLLPERRAQRRPPSRTMQQPPAVRCSEHDYEPIAAPSPSPQLLMYPHATMATAPVVRISDTDVMPVGDSDDSIDDRARLPPELTKEGDVVLPLDGKIEDSAMEGRELVEAGDTSEELESPQELQDRLEERFLNAATPASESRTDAEVNTSQVDSIALEELPLRRGARGLPQRLRTQAGKLRTRLRSIQRPTFAFADRQKSEKSRSTSSGKSEKSRIEKRPSRMDRIRSSFSERPRLSLPSPPKFHLPSRSKFRMPQRPKFSLPERAKFHLPERPKFNIKKPNIRLPSALSRVGISSTREKPQRSTESTIGSHRNIFDFSTYPRIFDKKSKNRSDYTTSTPKGSRAQSSESATLPRTKAASERWSQQYDDNAFIDDGITAVERSHPWRHPSLEEPRLSIRLEQEALAVARAIPWEERRRDPQEELEYMDYEPESSEAAEKLPPPRSKKLLRSQDESYEREQTTVDRESSGDQIVKEDMIMPEDFRPIQRSRSLDEQISHIHEDESYESSFAQMERERFNQRKVPSEGEEYEEDVDADEEQEPSSALSDREQQQSSGSSCDRRRRGVIEEIDSDEFFLREGGISQGDTNLGKYLTNEIRDALRSDEGNALADDEIIPIPPQRPIRSRSLRRRKEDSVESYDVIPPTRPKRERAGRQRSTESGDDVSRDRTRSESRHRIVYQAEGTRDTSPVEPLDDIVVVKPVRRRKSKSSQRSQSQIPTDTSTPPESKPLRPPSPSPTPPVAPARRKFFGRKINVEDQNGDAPLMCNGFTNWTRTSSVPEKGTSLPPAPKESLHERDIFIADAARTRSHEEIRRTAAIFQAQEYIEPVPVPPKRRSRSRGTSVAQDDDRTSHGAESLPEIGYAEDDILQDNMDSARDLSGYAIIEKREKPPKPLPPRRKRSKFATMPKPIAPKRPQRAYSTLRPTRSKDSSILSESIHAILPPTESEPYIEIDIDDTEHKTIRSDEILSKMQRRPLPAPPRPPRVRKDLSSERDLHIMHEPATESTIATQTDPLPDDMIIEEEITQAKLVVAPSFSGSQILVSTERIPSPSIVHTPSVPPLPMSQRLHRDSQAEPGYDTVSLKSPSPIREHSDMDERPHLSAPHLEESRHMEDTRTPPTIQAVLSPNEPLKIGSLEVGDLRVDRLSVSQIEAGKIVASEVDALIITASELRAAEGSFEENLSPAIIKELMAIRSHLETVAASHAQATSIQSIRSTEEQQKTDIPSKNIGDVRDERGLEEEISPATYDRPTSVEDDRSKESKDQKVNKIEVIDVQDKEPHTQSIVRLEDQDKETILTHTLSVPQLESDNKEVPNTYTLSIVQGTEDKSFQILDSGTLIPLTANTTESEAEKLSTSHSMSIESREDTRIAVPPSTDLSDTGSIIPPMEPTSHPTRGASKFDEAKVFLEDLKKEMSSLEKTDEQTSSEETENDRKKSRSRSSSPTKGMTCPVRQTASPVRSLPPAISVTPDIPDAISTRNVSDVVQPQRAIISYSPRVESQRDILIESSQSPESCFPQGATHFIAFPASQFPREIFSLNDQVTQRIDSDQTVTDSMLQLLRVLRITGVRAMRYFTGYLSSITSGEETEEKIREVELTLCALLLLIAGLLIYYFSNPRIVTHHHHWDYINPPQ